MGWHVRMDRYGATWSWFTTNPSGGGFGSSHCGSKGVALAHALRGVPAGPYTLTTNGKARACVRPAVTVGDVTMRPWGA